MDSMNYAQVCLTLLLVSVSVPASADEIKDLVDQMTEGQKGLKSSKAAMDALTNQNQKDMKERDAYRVSFGELAMQKDAKEDAYWKNGPDRRLKATDEMVEEWNSQCAEGRATLSEAQRATCKESRARIEPVITAIRADVKREAEAFEKAEIAPIEAIQVKQQAQMEKLAVKIKERYAAWSEIKKRVDALRDDLEKVRIALVEACKKAKTAEEIKLCNSVGWDGARQDLPPL